MSDNNHFPPAEHTARRDGAMDFTRYSTGQLLDLQDTLDRNAFPLNFAALIAELDRRNGASPELRWTGRLTRWNGLAGWLEGKWRRQPLYGEGTVEVNDGNLILLGRQRTWLGLPVERALAWPLERVRNVVSSRALARFEIGRRGWFPRRIELQMETPAMADTLAAALPDTRTARFEQRGLPLLAFEEQLRIRCPYTWVTPTLVLLNILVFAATWLNAGQLVDIENSAISFRMANVGPLTLGGEWWRLLTAIFAHGSLAHLLLNMWALWHIGRLSERMFGRWTFLCVYLGTGLIASLSTLVWDPARASLGASGAIFGLFGAFLAMLARRRNEIPRGVFRAHWIPTVLFVAYNLIDGAFSPGVDNAAHAGGLISGILSGFLLASSLTMSTGSLPRWRSAVAAAALGAVLATGSLLYLRSAKGPVPVAQQFAASNQWYFTGESKNLATWSRLASMASQGTVSNEILGIQFEKDVVPFWEMALPKLEALQATLQGEARDYAAAVTEFARIRLDWARAIVKATKNADEEQGRLARSKSDEITVALAQLQRLGARSTADRPMAGLTNLAAVRKLRRAFSRSPGNCIEEPPGYYVGLSDSDSRTDAPAMQAAAGCLAQRYFLEDDFKALDALLATQSARLADLPDDRSSLAGSLGGLDDLFTYGSLRVEDVLQRLASWHRAVPESHFPDLMEAVVYNTWAWSARGHGTVQQVSQQAWAAFGFRNEMAWSALKSAPAAARQSPLGCRITLSLQHDRSAEVEEMRRTMDECVRRFPQDYALYRMVLRRLMPRWSGSAEQVSSFINEMVARQQEPAATELYTRLYSAYAGLEQDEANIFTDTHADWVRMKSGFKLLLKKHPESDVILNSYLYFACIAEDRTTYRSLRPGIEGRVSATAWTHKTTLRSCDSALRYN